MPQRPSWCARPASTFASSTIPSRNRSVAARRERSGRGRCAGRGCGAPASLFFLPEILSGGALPILAGAYAAAQLDFDVGGTVGLLLIAWYGAEVLLARATAWHLSLRLLPALVLRDLLLPVLWIDAWLSDDFVWRGNAMNVHAKVDKESSETSLSSTS